MKSNRATNSSGNIFRDLGLPDADEHALKADMVIRLARLIQKGGLNQSEAATKLGIHQPDLSKLLRGHFEGFSLGRLFVLMQRLGSDLEIKVKPPKPNHVGRILVT
jgi:predicted XRE-type DNA-binding protein